MPSGFHSEEDRDPHQGVGQRAPDSAPSWTSRILSLKVEAGASFRNMAEAAGADVKTVRRWCGQNGGMTILPDSEKLRKLLRFLHEREALSSRPYKIAAAVERSCAEILQDSGYLTPKSARATIRAWEQEAPASEKDLRMDGFEEGKDA